MLDSKITDSRTCLPSLASRVLASLPGQLLCWNSDRITSQGPGWVLTHTFFLSFIHLYISHCWVLATWQEVLETDTKTDKNPRLQQTSNQRYVSISSGALLSISMATDIGVCKYGWGSVFLPGILLHASKVMLKTLQARLQNTWTVNFQMFKLDLEKAEEPEIKLPTSAGS